MWNDILEFVQKKKQKLFFYSNESENHCYCTQIYWFGWNRTLKLSGQILLILISEYSTEIEKKSDEYCKILTFIEGICTFMNTIIFKESSHPMDYSSLSLGLVCNKHSHVPFLVQLRLSK